MAHFILDTAIEDKDWDELFVIDWKSFRNTPEIAALFPGGLDPTKRAANAEGLKRGVFGGPTERAYAKLSEVQSGQVTAFISCRVYRGPKGIIDGLFAEEPPPVQLHFIQDEEDRAFSEWYWNRINDLMRSCKELQVPHIYIQALATDPEWHRQGAATMLIEWILDFAAKEKIGRCALQASPWPSSIGLYEKFGFRVIDEHTSIDEDRFPGRVGTPIKTMIKDL
ncbi:MAG: hypothetical protein M1818_000577 [Claussenomyces sp. TS43310]|nr:MAG: hypothetical protein M1818_000577 [Claussenomyces sp. TS43310]